MHDDVAVIAHWTSDYDEKALENWASKARAQLRSPFVSLGLIFLTPRFFNRAEEILEIVRVHAQVPRLMGCSSMSLIAGREEHEGADGIVLGLYALPEADLELVHFNQSQIETTTDPAQWHVTTGVSPDACNGWLVFADPFTLDAEKWLSQWNAAYPGVPILGGLASANPAVQATEVYLNGTVHHEGGVALAVGGKIALTGVVSQGCSPVGEPWTITRAERNVVYEIGNRPAYEVLAETFHGLSAEVQRETQGHLFVGLVVDEYLEEFHRGDFLIRNLIGADPRSGSIAVGAMLHTGQSIQFQHRDASAASDDLDNLLRRAQATLNKTVVYGGCLCCCNGRGQHLFGEPHHDANQIQESLGPLGLAGLFCNGEIGPIGNRNFLHGYTASLALFTRRQ